jgi:hypothetical protein
MNHAYYQQSFSCYNECIGIGIGIESDARVPFDVMSVMLAPASASTSPRQYQLRDTSSSSLHTHKLDAGWTLTRAL